MKRELGLYAKYLLAKVRLRDRVRFHGFAVVYAFKNSKIEFSRGGYANNR